MCHVHACADAPRREAPQKQFYFSKSEDTGTDWAQHSRLWGKETPGRCLLSHSGRCLPGDRCAEGSWAPNWGLPSAPVTTQRPLCDACTPAPSMRQAEPRERGPWGVFGHCGRGALGGVTSARSTCPHIPVVPGAYLRPGSCGTESVVTAVYRDAALAPSSAPQGRGPAPGASCQAVRAPREQSTTDRARELPSWWGYKPNTVNTNPSAGLAARRGPRSHREEVGSGPGGATATEGGGRGRSAPSPDPPVACLRLLQGPHGWSGAGARDTRWSQELPQSRSCMCPPSATPVHVAAGVSPPPLLSHATFPANCHKHSGWSKNILRFYHASDFITSESNGLI